MPVKKRVTSPTVGDYVDLDATEDAVDQLPDDDETYTEPAEDENEVPRNTPPVQGGWKAGRKQRESGGEFAKDFKLSEQEQLIKFLDEDGPYVVYKEHWIERTGKKSFFCIGQGCPLCRVGDSPRNKWCFNIAVIDEDGVELKSLTAGARLFADLEKKNDDPKRGPLTKGYWSISRTGGKSGWTTTVAPVSPRLLEDDWSVSEDDIIPALAELKPYTSAIVKIPSKAELKAIADEIDD